METSYNSLLSYVGCDQTLPHALAPASYNSLLSYVIVRPETVSDKPGNTIVLTILC